MSIRTRLALLTLTLTLPAGSSSRAETHAQWNPGLVAHYYDDPLQWDGNWPDPLSTPKVDPHSWTFTRYAYSRVEPVINHLFIRRGWFSVRWKGYLDTTPDPSDGGAHTVSGSININPNNSTNAEFTLRMADGTIVTRDQLTSAYAGCTGLAAQVHLKPKGNGNQNSLTVDGRPFLLRNADTYDFLGYTLNVRLYNDKLSPNGQALGKWWIRMQGTDVILLCNGVGIPPSPASQVAAPSSGPASKTLAPQADYLFEVLADDGCRLFIDGKPVIDDWRPCWDKAPDALRVSAPIRLGQGKHALVVEYFQGQSQNTEDDRDPMRLYWSCPSRNIRRQIVAPAHFFHTEVERGSPGR